MMGKDGIFVQILVQVLLRQLCFCRLAIRRGTGLQWGEKDKCHKNPYFVTSSVHFSMFFMRKLRIGLIPVMFLVPVESRYLRHLVIGQREVEYGDILLYVVRIARTGDSHHAPLQMPAEYDLHH